MRPGTATAGRNQPYEAVCVTRYDEVVANATTSNELRSGFADKFFGTLASDAPLHRLWYDLRNQSLFDESFRADVLEIDGRREAMIWRVISRYAELSGGQPATSPAVVYVILDGFFQRALLCALSSGLDGEVAQLREELPRVLDMLVPLSRRDAPAAGDCVA